MIKFYKDCLESVLTRENIIEIWNNRNSSEDIINLNTSSDIRYKLNGNNSRNVEIKIKTTFGIIYKTIFLVENNQIIFPLQFHNLYRLFFQNKKINFLDFEISKFNISIDMIIGAYSFESITYALANKNIELYSANNIHFEIIQSLENEFDVFVKKNIYENKLFGNPNILTIENVSIIKFTYNEDTLGSRATDFSLKHIEEMKKKRLLELYTID